MGIAAAGPGPADAPVVHNEITCIPESLENAGLLIHRHVGFCSVESTVSVFGEWKPSKRLLYKDPSNRTAREDHDRRLGIVDQAP